VVVREAIQEVIGGKCDCCMYSFNIIRGEDGYLYKCEDMQCTYPQFNRYKETFPSSFKFIKKFVEDHDKFYGEKN
jgi:hypothetical protein